MVAGVEDALSTPSNKPSLPVSMPCGLPLFKSGLAQFLNNKMQGKWFYMTLSSKTPCIFGLSLFRTLVQGKSIPMQETWLPRGPLCKGVKQGKLAVWRGSTERDASQLSAVPATPAEVTDPWMMAPQWTSRRVTPASANLWLLSSERAQEPSSAPLTCTTMGDDDDKLNHWV